MGSMRISVTESGASAVLESRTASVATAPKVSDSEPTFTQVLQGVGSELQQGEAAMHAAVAHIGANESLSLGQLLALQSGVYRYSEVIDLASRLVDRANAGVKTILQGSGQ